MVARQSLSFDNLSYQLPNNVFVNSVGSKPILRGLNGTFNGGELSAILGASGCGKTSFLNALSGLQKQNVSGVIKINGSAVSTHLIRKVSSYIVDEFVAHNQLTVLETMSFAASFRKLKTFDKHKKVGDILTSLGLLDRRDVVVQSLSGGERKRLSIAIELFNDPLILFLDEPTTGLDASSANQCVRLLKKIAREDGKIIICTIHAPSARILLECDLIYALADGCCIYNGAFVNLVRFLSEENLICPEDYNPADFLIEIAMNGDENNRLTEKIRNGSKQDYRETLRDNEHSNTNFQVQSSSKILPFSQQVKHLMHRKYLVLVRDRIFVPLRLFAHIATSIMLGLLFQNVGNNAFRFVDNYRYLQSVTMAQTFFAYSSLLTASSLISILFLFRETKFISFSVPNDFYIIKRETFNQFYSLKAYFVAFVLADFPVTLVCSIFYVPLSYVMTDQPLEIRRFLAFFVISLSLSYAAQGVGILIGCTVNLKVSLNHN